MNATQMLREILAGTETHFVPSCYDALSARLIEDAGLKLCLMSGHGVSASRLGMPDTELITQTEMVSQLRDICAAVPGFPIVADADTGYGNAMSVRRTIQEYARAGAAGIMLEDQLSPKRCGHFDGKQVVSREDAKIRIRAAVEARDELGLDILILARTDSQSTLGFDAALQRCIDFQEEGADMLFMEALETEAEMREFCASVNKPTWANVFPGGKTPYLGQEELRDIGFNVVLDPTLLSTVVRAMQDHLSALSVGNSAVAPPQVSFEGMKKIVGLDKYEAISQRYQSST